MTYFRFFLRAVAGAILPTVLFPLLAISAGGWGVEPVRIDFDRQARSAAVTVTNNTDRKLNVQIKAMAWDQDEKGQDQYAETKEIVFSPRIITLDAGEARIIRVGTKLPPVAKERTYRLFVEELPVTTEKPKGITISLALRYSIPIFLSPVKPEAHGLVEGLGVKGGNIRATVRNTGNVSFQIRSITLKGRDRYGKERFTKDIAGWYLLSGVSRVYKTDLTNNQCRDISQLEIGIITDKFNMDSHLMPFLIQK
jgi:fimbrial chaperone protein